MPTRSGLDFHSIAPTHFVCSYCFQAAPAIPGILQFSGMVTKRVQVRIDDSVDDFVMLPQFTQIWTEPHCYWCHRKVLGYPTWAPHEPRTFKYA